MGAQFKLLALPQGGKNLQKKRKTPTQPASSEWIILMELRQNIARAQQILSDLEAEEAERLANLIDRSCGEQIEEKTRVPMTGSEA
jgi:hypothetical protein